MDDGGPCSSALAGSAGAASVLLIAAADMALLDAAAPTQMEVGFRQWSLENGA